MELLKPLTPLLLLVAVCAQDMRHDILQHGAKGKDLVLAAETMIGNMCIFPQDYGFFRRLAYFYTKFGEDMAMGEGGIYKVSNRMRESTNGGIGGGGVLRVDNQGVRMRGKN